MRDPWQVLGISRTATNDEIRKAYKKMAMQHHPDKGGDHAMFTELNTAYNSIKDEDARREYIYKKEGRGPFRGHQQNPFEQHTYQGSPFDNVNINMNDIFSGFRHHAKPPTNRDINITYTCTIEDSHTGANKLVEVKIPNGATRFVDIDIPRGVDHGHKIRYPGLGDSRYPQLPNGDLYVTIKIQPHSKWSKQRNNLHTHVDIHAIDAMLGIEQVIETIDGRQLAMKIPAGIQPNTKMRVPESGTYSLDMTRRGDLIVEVKVNTPIMTADSIQEYLKRK